ncbi:SEL1-like repeat protein [Chitinophaga rhizophila]|uniref:SEL1-like repeat protein n=1 Tax=Chitinophaga rhizophila TaxID=2866212 RepID=A0ABS7GJ80_9BACT|nr:SEL1-like repeat protein [Chitinophaga rhizophila]MBW8687761.1 SEL1-like repeat protein [Chitinophaga rhizophila]
MSHRMYLYNLSQPMVVAKDQEIADLPLASYGTNTEDVQMMMEWGYELPLFFYPLFSGEITIDTPIYNGSEGGLYAPAAPGITAFYALYDFITAHQETLIDDIPAFQKAKDKIMAYFGRKVIHNTFHLDAWDVFNMSDEAHADLAATLRQEIQETNTIISIAIAANNPALLDDCPLFHNTGYYYNNFRDLLNGANYDFGWQVLSSSVFADEEEPETFTEGSLFGLKNSNGSIIAPAIYDEIYAWPYGSELAIIFKEGKAGYIDKSGTEVIPCQFDDAFDFENELAIVIIAGKFGVIDTNGGFKINPLYDDAHFLTWECMAVKQQNLWGIINYDNDILLPFTDAKEIIAEDQHGFSYFKLIGHQEEEKYYTHRFHFLTDGPVEAIDHFEEYYIVSKDGYSALFDQEGTLLLGYDYQEIRHEYLLGLLIVTSSAGSGLYKPGHGWILPCAYDQIIPLKDAQQESDGTAYAIVKQHKIAGLAAVRDTIRWILPVAYQDFNWLKEGHIGYKEGKLWGVATTNGQLLSKATYTSINGKQGHLSFALALGFQPGGIDVIDEDGIIRPLTPSEALNEVDTYPQAYFSKKEIQQLKDLSASAEKAFELNDEGLQMKEAGEYEKAIALFNDAAEAGYAGALTNIGHIYEVAPGYKDPAKAIAYYLQAARSGEPYAMSNLGLTYMYGKGIEPDIPEALKWLKKAAAMKHADAFVYLGDMHYLPQFNRVNYDKAREYYTAAFFSGMDIADALGHIHEITEDYQQAHYYYQQAADNGNAFAQWRLAGLYMDGKGVDTDLHQAMELLLQAVETQPEAHIYLATLYATAPFLDEQKAQEHLKAAELLGLL